MERHVLIHDGVDDRQATGTEPAPGERKEEWWRGPGTTERAIEPGDVTAVLRPHNDQPAEQSLLTAGPLEYGKGKEERSQLKMLMG